MGLSSERKEGSDDSAIPINLETPLLLSSITCSPLRCGFSLVLVVLTLAAPALSPAVYAQCPSVCDSSTSNTGFGVEANPFDAGSRNTAVGDHALQLVRSGTDNTAIGLHALLSDTSGSDNTATGTFALASNSANNNTADGFQALLSNTTGRSLPSNAITHAVDPSALKTRISPRPNFARPFA
jgi:hypothetical protein